MRGKITELKKKNHTYTEIKNILNIEHKTIPLNWT